MAASYGGRGTANVEFRSHGPQTFPQVYPDHVKNRLRREIKWIPYSTEQGQVFYYNDGTKESVWELPTGAEVDYSGCPELDPEAARKAQEEEDRYYAGYGYANKAAYEEAYRKAEVEAKQQEADARKTDPFFELRQHQAAQEKQQQEWNDW